MANTTPLRTCGAAAGAATGAAIGAVSAVVGVVMGVVGIVPGVGSSGTPEQSMTAVLFERFTL